MPGRDGLLVLAENEGMPPGVALLDTPDIDSVVQAHREFAHQFLDASDLWLFMTSASRYADAAVWELLQQARERDASLAIVLSRVPPESARQLSSHFDAMLQANGLTGAQRFMIAETVLTDGMLPPEVYGPVREWLDETSVQQERRVAVLTQTMSGVLDTFRTRVPALAESVQTQVSLQAELRAEADSSLTGRRWPSSTRPPGTGRCCAARSWPAGRTSPAPGTCCGCCRCAAAARPQAASASGRCRPAPSR